MADRPVFGPQISPAAAAALGVAGVGGAVEFIRRQTANVRERAETYGRRVRRRLSIGDTTRRLIVRRNGVTMPRYGSRRRYSGRRSRGAYRSRGRRVLRTNRRRFLPYQVTIPKQMPYAQQLKVTLPMYANVVLNAPATDDLATAGSFGIACNDIADPLGTRGLLRPLYTSTWGGIYRNYVVVGAVITAKFVNQADTPNLCRVGIAGPFEVTPVTFDATTITNGHIQTNPGFKWKWLGVDSIRDRVRSLTAGFSARKDLQLPHVDYQNDAGNSFSAVASPYASPSRISRWTVFQISPDGVTDPASVNVEVRVDYQVIYFNRVSDAPLHSATASHYGYATTHTPV